MSEFGAEESGNAYLGPLYESRYIDNDDEWLSFNAVDAETETESIRQESKDRLRVRSNELKRFHDKICVRVTARERQNRLEAQRAQKYLDAKCAKLFSTIEPLRQSGNTPPVQISTYSYFQELKKKKSIILKDCPLSRQIDQSLRLDAEIREELLQSTEISRFKAFNNECEGRTENVSENTTIQSPVLLPEQRIALYALVRRQYMEMNRAKTQNNVKQGASQASSSTEAKSPTSNSSIVAAVCGSRARRAGKTSSGDRWTSAGVKVVDMTTGCETRVHRQTSTSTTPWRKKKKNTKIPTAAVEHERFVRALQAQLGTPALCSCAKAGPTSIGSSGSCANNCALYKQPKKREKLLLSVYKQQQHETPTAATSPLL